MSSSKMFFVEIFKQATFCNLFITLIFYLDKILDQRIQASLNLLLQCLDFGMYNNLRCLLFAKSFHFLAMYLFACYGDVKVYLPSHLGLNDIVKINQ